MWQHPQYCLSIRAPIFKTNFLLHVNVVPHQHLAGCKRGRDDHSFTRFCTAVIIFWICLSARKKKKKHCLKFETFCFWAAIGRIYPCSQSGLQKRSKAVLASPAGASNKPAKHVLKIVSYSKKDTTAKCTRIHWIAMWDKHAIAKPRGCSAPAALEQAVSAAFLPLSKQCRFDTQTALPLFKAAHCCSP